MTSIRTFFVLCSFGILCSSSAAAQTDPLVEQIVQSVSKDRVTATVQSLESYGTRSTDTAQNDAVEDWLYKSFKRTLGLETWRDGFTVGGQYKKSVLARIPGRTRPDEIVAISAHFDSTSEDPSHSAPGADDAASAIAAVLEAATLMRDYAFDRTVEFYCYNGEEQGRKGSISIAEDYASRGVNLVAVLNADMIGYWPDGWARDLDVAYDPISEWLADAVVAAGVRYVGIPVAKKPTGHCRDDHVSFTDLGFSAVTVMDCWEAHNTGTETTPYYHTTGDTLATLNLDCMTQAVQVEIAALAELAGPRSLLASASTVSASAGGTIQFELRAGPPQGLRTYFVLGSVSGTSPGIPLPGGPVLPLHFDSFTVFTIHHANGPNLIDTLGTLDANGQGTAAFQVPPGVLVGLEGVLQFTFAYPLLTPLDFASGFVPVDVVQ